MAVVVVALVGQRVVFVVGVPVVVSPYLQSFSNMLALFLV
jgi:hypothetical protein